MTLLQRWTTSDYLHIGNFTVFSYTAVEIDKLISLAFRGGTIFIISIESAFRIRKGETNRNAVYKPL